MMHKRPIRLIKHLLKINVSVYYCIIGYILQGITQVKFVVITVILYVRIVYQRIDSLSIQ